MLLRVPQYTGWPEPTVRDYLTQDVNSAEVGNPG